MPSALSVVSLSAFGHSAWHVITGAIATGATSATPREAAVREPEDVGHIALHVPGQRPDARGMSGSSEPQSHNGLLVPSEALRTVYDLARDADALYEGQLAALAVIRQILNSDQDSAAEHLSVAHTAR